MPRRFHNKRRPRDNSWLKIDGELPWNEIREISTQTFNINDSSEIPTLHTCEGCPAHKGEACDITSILTPKDQECTVPSLREEYIKGERSF